MTFLHKICSRLNLSKTLAPGFHSKVPLLLAGDARAEMSGEVQQLAQGLGLETKLLSKIDLAQGICNWPGSGSGVLLIKRLEEAPAIFLDELRELLEEGALGGYRLPDGWTIVATVGNCSSRAMDIFPQGLLDRFCRLGVDLTDVDWREGWNASAAETPGVGMINGALRKMHPSVRRFRHEYERPNYKLQNLNRHIAGFQWELASRLLVAAEHLGDTIAGEWRNVPTPFRVCLGSVLGDDRVAEMLMLLYLDKIKAGCDRHPLGIMSSLKPLPDDYLRLGKALRRQRN